MRDGLVFNIANLSFHICEFPVRIHTRAHKDIPNNVNVNINVNVNANVNVTLR